MKKLLVCLLSGMMIFSMAACGGGEPAEDEAVKSNLMTSSVAWKQTAAEYEALYYQAFNVAKDRIDAALAEADGKPLAIVTDVDDTLVLHNAYWARLLSEGKEFFDDAIWDEYIPSNALTAAPGAVELLNYCKDNNIEVFYVTNRDQGEGTYDMATNNLKFLNFPYVDKEHLIVQIDTSDKEVPQKEIAKTHEVILYMGDNLNDFQRKYYVEDVAERKALMQEDKELYGEKFILLPNPTDGHWIKAIFGESEPQDTPENRQKWMDTVTAGAWEK